MNFLVENKLKLVVPNNFKSFGTKVNSHINHIRGTKENYITDMELVRFNNGEGKCVLHESVRDNDIYILTDVGNYDITYPYQRGTNHMTPDEHYQDIKRIISAMSGHAARLTLIMPYLYQSRQDKRSLRESLDCAMALQELERLGINEIITFDAHNPSVANAIPYQMTFSNGYATSDLLLNILENENIDFNKLFVVGPDEGARTKARFVADILGGVGYGNFDKRRDYTQVVGGSNPIEYHQFIGPENLNGIDVIVYDDMIASGSSLLDTIYKLKERGARKIYLMTTFSLFTKGINGFEKAYQEGLFDKLYSTNLTYVPDEYKELPWYADVDCSSRVSKIIHNLNEGNSIKCYLNDSNNTIAKVRSLRKQKDQLRN